MVERLVAIEKVASSTLVIRSILNSMKNFFIPFMTLIVAMISIQFGASIAKTVFPIAGVYGTTVFRLVIAAFILLAIWRPWRLKLTKKSYRAIAVYGASLGFMNLLFYMALERIPLGIAVALEFTGPLAISILHSKKATDFLWAILAAVGIYLILPVSYSQSSIDLLGAFYALGAGVCWALYIFFGQKAGEGEHTGAVTSLGMLMAALVVLPASFLLSPTPLYTPGTLPKLVLVAVLSSALPYSLEMISLKKLPTKTFGILMSIEPAIATLAGFFYLGEVLTLKQTFAIVCIIIASLGGALNAKKKV